MLRIDKAIKSWKESAALNDHVNLYGFWSDTVFLAKSGELGMVLHVPGVDYESLDHSSQEYAVKRLEAALKSFGPGFYVYQYLFKSNRPEIPFANYDDPVVQTEVDHRREFFLAKRRPAGGHARPRYRNCPPENQGTVCSSDSQRSASRRN